MDKRFILRMLMPTVILAVAVISLLMVIPGTAPYFTWFSWAWAATIVAGAFGVKYLLAGIFTNGTVLAKRTAFLVAAAFLVITLFCLVWAIAVPQDWIAPLIAIIVTGAIFLGVLFTGGRKWDGADNQKAGYKNYYQRKAEEEKNKK